MSGVGNNYTTDKAIALSLPASDKQIRALRAGNSVLLTGVLYTGRDAAHKRLIEALEAGKTLPVDLAGQFIYYVGPSPAKEGAVIGPAGPTTSGRMDSYTPPLLDLGLKGMIGKGLRSPEVVRSMVKNGAVYLSAVGGAAALIAQSIKKATVICYEDLGTEAIYRLEVENFPAVVAVDTLGNNLYESEPPKYREE
jgi:fumarate hydratase subunit beta